MDVPQPYGIDYNDPYQVAGFPRGYGPPRPGSDYLTQTASVAYPNGGIGVDIRPQQQREAASVSSRDGSESTDPSTDSDERQRRSQAPGPSQERDLGGQGRTPGN